ncbi:MAG: hypothetical protein ACKVOM_08350 [Ferruginibacter sp.]
MKSIKLLSLVAIVIAFASCTAVRQATNTTGTAVFSLNGKWQLSSNNPENTMLNSVATVTLFSSQAKLTFIANNTQCYRENDIKWKNIKSDNTGGFTIDNLLSNCTSGALNYQPAAIAVVSNDDIRITGKNAAGQDNTQTWTRIK